MYTASDKCHTLQNVFDNIANYRTRIARGCPIPSSISFVYYFLSNHISASSFSCSDAFVFALRKPILNPQSSSRGLCLICWIFLYFNTLCVRTMEDLFSDSSEFEHTYMGIAIGSLDCYSKKKITLAKVTD